MQLAVDFELTGLTIIFHLYLILMCRISNFGGFGELSSESENVHLFRFDHFRPLSFCKIMNSFSLFCFSLILFDLLYSFFLPPVDYWCLNPLLFCNLLYSFTSAPSQTIQVSVYQRIIDMSHHFWSFVTYERPILDDEAKPQNMQSLAGCPLPSERPRNC